MYSPVDWLSEFPAFFFFFIIIIIELPVSRLTAKRGKLSRDTTEPQPHESQAAPSMPDIIRDSFAESPFSMSEVAFLVYFPMSHA